MNLILQRDSHLRIPEVLFSEAEKVKFPLSEKDKETIKKLRDGMKELQPLGIHAKQVGVNREIFAVKKELFPDDILINAEIISTEGKETSLREGCLSINLGRSPLKIFRSEIVTVRYLNENGEENEIKANGLESKVLSHEIDHGKGILISSRYNPYKK